MIDLIIYDDQNDWSPSLNASLRGGKGTGGFEVQAVQIAEGVAKAGRQVVAIMPGHAAYEQNGVGYYGISGRPDANIAGAHCRTLLTCRQSKIPDWIKADRVVTTCVDDPRHDPPAYEHLKGRSTLVHLSQWQKSLYEELGHTGGVVVPSMIDDWIYDCPLPAKTPGSYVCVNAWNKGTDATLKLWAELKLQGTLSVGSPYGAPVDAFQRCAKVGAKWLGMLSPRQVVRALAQAEAVFRVCERSETFGVTDAIAEVVGTEVNCLCTKGLGAAPSVLESHNVTDNADAFAFWLRADTGPVPTRTAHDYRVSTIMPQWLKVLGLE